MQLSLTEIWKIEGGSMWDKYHEIRQSCKEFYSPKKMSRMDIFKPLVERSVKLDV